ncbi:MAG: helix-hairpin-helix domain-containing protein [Xanthomonadales bacterium]|nr:helix-hairpin-helix domain-containing protein [Xanthomonadales bacterium]
MNRTLAALALSLAFALPVFAATPVDINHADAQTIAASLDGVGPAKAKAIVAYRNSHGQFKSAAQLAQVKGIGMRTLQLNKDAIRLSGGKSVAAHKSSKRK